MSLRTCKLRYKTILDFIRHAKNLEVFDLRECVVGIRKDLINDIINVLQRAKEENNREIFTLIIDQKIDKETEMLIKSEETKQILKVVIKYPITIKKSCHIPLMFLN